MWAACVCADVTGDYPPSPCDPVRGIQTAVRWEWIDRNPASTAQLPKATTRAPSSPEPEAVARVIATARELGLDLLGLYLWLAAVTGARRGELCGLQWKDLDLERGVVHIA